MTVMRTKAIGAYVVVTVAAPVALFGLLPDMSAEGGTDYMIEPAIRDPDVRVAMGLVAAALLAGAAAVLRLSGRADRQSADRRVLVPLLIAGLYSAFTYRAATSAVIGANIGASLLVLAGYVVVPCCVLLATAAAIRNRRRLSVE